MMNDQGNQGTPFSPPLAEEGGELFSRRHTARRFLWIGVALGLALALVLSGWAGFLNMRFTIQPLRADANTLYLANWSKDLDNWS
jgi:hypothetical protein